MVALMLLAFGVSCKKSGGGYPTEGQMTATLSGSKYTANSVEAVDVQANHLFTVSGYFIAGSDSALLSLSFPDTAAIGEAEINTNASPLQLYYFPQEGNGIQYGASMLYAMYGDTITITSLDASSHKVSGTFSGFLPLINGSTSPDTLVITNGQFSTSYKVQ